MAPVCSEHDSYPPPMARSLSPPPPTRAQPRSFPLRATPRLSAATYFRARCFRCGWSTFARGPGYGPVSVSSFESTSGPAPPERGALFFIPYYNLEELIFCRTHPACGVVHRCRRQFRHLRYGDGASWVERQRKVIAIEPHPVTHARLHSTAPLPCYTRFPCSAAPTGPAAASLMIENRRHNLGAIHNLPESSLACESRCVAADSSSRDGLWCRMAHALKIDVEGL